MILMMPLMVESPTREEKVIEYIGSCTYNHFLDWLDDAKDFVVSLDDEGMYQLEAMIRDQVLADKGLPNDREYFLADPDREWFKHVEPGDMEYLLGLVRGWRTGSDECLDRSRWMKTGLSD